MLFPLFGRNCRFFLFPFLLPLFCLLSSRLAPAAESPHSRAVAMAREGKAAEALVWLSGQYAAQPENLPVAADYLTVLAWTGRDAEALDLLYRITGAGFPLPPYALAAAAKAARNLGRFAEAETLYRLGAFQFPDKVDFPAGLVLTLVDCGRTNAALDQGREIAALYPDHPEALLASAYAEEAAGELFPALRLYERILARDPLNPEARRRRILVADSLGAPFLAADMAASDPNLLAADEWARIHANRAAQAIRWSDLPPEDESRPFAAADRALEIVEAEIDRLNTSTPLNRPYIRRLRADRLVALRNRQHMAEVMREYELLAAEGTPLPYFALVAAGDAYLDAEQPERARELYEAALRQQPDPFEIELALFYALADAGEFSEAKAILKRLSRQEPDWLPARFGALPTPNPRRLQAEMATILEMAWTGDLPAAQQRAEQLIGEAPGNPDLHLELGNLYSSRGWPRLALATYRRGLSFVPRHTGLQAELALALLSLHEEGEAEAIVRDLSVRTPEDRQIRRLRESWELRRKREWRTEVRGARNSGSELGSRELALDSVLYSQVFAEHLRALASGHYASADFPEGDEEFRRFGFGFELRRPELEALAEITYNAEGGRDTGGRVNAVWHPDDYWSLAAGFELFSRETPLRALRHGIEADAALVGLSYRKSDRQQVGLDLHVMDFSDGNFRRSLFGRGRQRLFTGARLQVEGELEIYASKNSREDAPYYNPRDDLFAGIGMEASWRQQQRPSRSFTHRLAVSGGRYWQDGFDPGWTTSILYEHLWTFSQTVELTYGVGRNRRVFDGDPEYATAWHLQGSWRF